MRVCVYVIIYGWHLFCLQTNRQTDQEQLTELAEGGVEYEDWKYSCFPNLLDVIEQFPSLQKMDICLLLTGLPLLQTVRTLNHKHVICSMYICDMKTIALTFILCGFHNDKTMFILLLFALGS